MALLPAMRAQVSGRVLNVAWCLGRRVGNLGGPAHGAGERVLATFFHHYSIVQACASA
jgi:hypothetical protein